jgi:RNA polymerase sigma factor (sigma-70 family)
VTEPDDIELLDRWRAGDKTAGQALFTRHFASIYGFFRNKFEAEADELVQSTFLACLHQRDRFRGDASFRTYLFGIARNVLYRALETRQRDQRLDFDVSSIAQIVTTPRTKLVADQEQRQLLEALRRLPVAQQTLLELHYFEEVSLAELAVIFEATDGAMRVRLHRARVALRELVEELAAPEALADVDTMDAWAKRVLDRPTG